MNTKELYKYFLSSTGVTTDSRIKLAGRMFFALRGENFDGNRFARTALENGCSVAVIDKAEYAIPGRTILVPDVLTSLQQLASYHRQQFNIPVLAITGSNGKTTTKELISAVLSEKYSTLATRGNLNNHIGVPLTLLEINGGHQMAIIEMGANHIGEIASLCLIAMPDYGLITNIGSAHLEGFGSREGVFKAKTELFSYLNNHGGTAFLNSQQISLLEYVKKIGLKYVGYGSGHDDLIKGSLISSSEMLDLDIMIKKQRDEKISLTTQLSGVYNFENILSAVCTGIYFDVPPALVKLAIESYVPGNNRSQLFSTDCNKLLLDAYNANPDSMQAAIKNFRAMPGEKKSLILGDMLELGPYAPVEHQKIIDLLKDLGYSEVFLVGELFCKTKTPEGFRCFQNVSDLTEWLIKNKLTGRFILLKGSRGLQLEKCIDKL